MTEFQIVVPPRSEGDPLSDELRQLTKVIIETQNLEHSHGLGGEFGYGVDYENDVFMLHQYCWCERDTCDWCGEKYLPNFLFKFTEFSVHWYKWIGRSMEIEQGNSFYIEYDLEYVFDMLNFCVDSLKA